MVPSVAQRGSSFKGAGQYYLHDKQAQTSERVGWTLTHNVPTQDPHKAMKWMAYTAMNAETIKQQNGTSRAGAKSQGKPVYAYSLAWHPEDNPSREEMEKAAYSSLEKLGLKDHQAVIVAHRDQDHPHVHVICNLVNPETGRTASQKMDFNRLSVWAQEHDRAHGRDHCPERIKNNAQRMKDEARTQFVKHRGEKEHRAAQIQSIHDKAKDGQSFTAALQENGYTLAQGNKGRLVLVDDQGEVYSLSRQLKHENGRGFRAKDVKASLKGVELKDLPEAKELVAIRQGADRDGYAAEQEDKLFEAAIEHDRAQRAADREAWEERKAANQARAKDSLANLEAQKARHAETGKTIKAVELGQGGQLDKVFNEETQETGEKESLEAYKERMRQRMKNKRDKSQDRGLDPP